MKHIVITSNGIKTFRSIESYAKFTTRKFPTYTRWAYLRAAHGCTQAGLEQYCADKDGVMRLESYVTLPLA